MTGAANDAPDQTASKADIAIERIVRLKTQLFVTANPYP